MPALNRSRKPKSLCIVLLGIGGASCGTQEQPLGEDAVADRESDAAADVSESDATQAEASPGATTVPPPGADAAVDLPGAEFGFQLSEQVYIDLSGPRVVTATSVERSDWDLRFEGYQAFTNGGAAGVGKGASFGPSTELDLLFDTVPEVPMRADLSDGAMMGWFWFSDVGITSRFHVYGVRDAEGRTFKVQVLNYYGTGDTGQVSAQYTLRYAEISEGELGDTIELSGIDATAGGITAPADAPSGCVDLSRGEILKLTKDEWSARSDWHLCFQRTDVFLNGGLSGPGNVTAVDLEVDRETGEDVGLTDAEMGRTAESERERFDAISLADLDASYLTWERTYDVMPRIGSRWVMGSAEEPQPVPGTWFVRGADGASYYAVYVTKVTAGTATSPPEVRAQIKPLTPR